MSIGKVKRILCAIFFSIFVYLFLTWKLFTSRSVPDKIHINYYESLSLNPNATGHQISKACASFTANNTTTTSRLHHACAILLWNESRRIYDNLKDTVTNEHLSMIMISLISSAGIFGVLLICMCFNCWMIGCCGMCFLSFTVSIPLLISLNIALVKIATHYAPDLLPFIQIIIAWTVIVVFYFYIRNIED